MLIQCSAEDGLTPATDPSDQSNELNIQGGKKADVLFPEFSTFD